MVKRNQQNHYLLSASQLHLKSQLDTLKCAETNTVRKAVGLNHAETMCGRVYF